MPNLRFSTYKGDTHTREHEALSHMPSFFRSFFLAVSNHKQLPPVTVALCQGRRAGRQQLYGWWGRRAGCCCFLPWSRLHHWKFPSALEIRGCYSVRSRWCICLNVVFEGKAASDNWEAGKLANSLTLGDLAPGFLGFSCMRFAGFDWMEGGGAGDLHEICQTEARAVQGAPMAQQHHLDLAGLRALRSDGSRQYSRCPAPVLQEAPRISCLGRMLISCKGSWGSPSLRRSKRGVYEDGIWQVAGVL